MKFTLFLAGLCAVVALSHSQCTEDEIKAMKTCVMGEKANMKDMKAEKEKKMSEMHKKVRATVQDAMSKAAECFPTNSANPTCKPPPFLSVVGGANYEVNAGANAGPLSLMGKDKGKINLPGPLGQLPPLGGPPMGKSKSWGGSKGKGGSKSWGGSKGKGWSKGKGGSKGKMSKSAMMKKMMDKGVTAEQFACMGARMVQDKMKKCKMPQVGSWVETMMVEKIQMKMDKMQKDAGNSSSAGSSEGSSETSSEAKSGEGSQETPGGHKLMKMVKMLFEEGGVDQASQMLQSMVDTMCGDEADTVKSCIADVAAGLKTDVDAMKAEKKAMMDEKCDKMDSCKAALSDSCSTTLENMCECYEQTKCERPNPKDMMASAKECGVPAPPMSNPFGGSHRTKRNAFALQRVARGAHHEEHEKMRPFFCKCRGDDNMESTPDIL